MVHIHLRVRGDRKILADLAWARDKMAAPFDQPMEFQVIAAAGMARNMDAECDPDGIPWEKLSPYYADWKASVRPGAPMGVFDGIMKDWANLVGTATASGDRMTMTYGTGDPVAMMHAIKFTNGGIVTGTSQPPRPFYGLTVEAEAEATHLFGQLFAYLTR